MSESPNSALNRSPRLSERFPAFHRRFASYFTTFGGRKCLCPSGAALLAAKTSKRDGGGILAATRGLFEDATSNQYRVCRA